MRISFSPRRISSRGWFEAGSGANSIRQRPRSLALADRDCEPNEIQISSPGFAVPQIGIGRSRCRIMWSENTLGTVTSAAAKGEPILAFRTEMRRIRRRA